MAKDDKPTACRVVVSMHSLYVEIEAEGFAYPDLADDLANRAHSLLVSSLAAAKAAGIDIRNIDPYEYEDSDDD